MCSTDNSNLGTRPYSRGLHDIGNGLYAWLQPDGGWGWSNAGLVVDGEESLLVDTLFDLRLTADMLRAMRDAEPRATRDIDTLVNTHSNGDHCNGNSLVTGAEIVSSEATALEMPHESPAMMAGMMEAAAAQGEQADATAEFLLHCFDRFHFEGIEQRLPDTTYSGYLERRVGDKHVQMYQAGPAHTAGDTLVYVVEDRAVYTGDILFIEGHP